MASGKLNDERQKRIEDILVPETVGLVPIE